MAVSAINPKSGLVLERREDMFVDAGGGSFPIVNGIPRIAEAENYSSSFGLQWNRFAQTQLDRERDGIALSKERFFAETGWLAEELAGKDVLEVGSGAGRFSRVVLEHTSAVLYSVDYSDAVSANYRNNGQIAPGRFHLYQASIYEMPFPDASFDRVFCLGVLQHTPEFEESVAALVRKAKLGGRIVVDFYPIKGWWTKINAKYLLRPLARRISHERLLRLIEGNVDWLLKGQRILRRAGLGALNRFVPLCDLSLLETVLDARALREWTILDTFDQYSPVYDQPQRIADVAAMFRKCGAKVEFAGFIPFGAGMSAAVVRGVRVQ